MFVVGPAFITFGYLANAIKTLLVVKTAPETAPVPETYSTAVCQYLCVNVTTDGRPHLGAAILSTTYNTRYVSNKITTWVQNYNCYHRLVSPSSMRLTLRLRMESSANYLYYTFPTT